MRLSKRTCNLQSNGYMEYLTPWHYVLCEALRSVIVFTNNHLLSMTTKREFLITISSHTPKCDTTHCVHIGDASASAESTPSSTSGYCKLPLNGKTRVNAWSHTKFYIWDDNYDNSVDYWGVKISCGNIKDGLCRLPISSSTFTSVYERLKQL